MKTYPKVGDKLYLQQRTGNYWVDMVKRPYTVVEVTPTNVIIQECKLVFNGPRYFDTLPDGIEADPCGVKETLYWKPTKEMWGTKGRVSDYPQYAIFGNWEYQPYLN